MSFGMNGIWCLSVLFFSILVRPTNSNVNAALRPVSSEMLKKAFFRAGYVPVAPVDDEDDIAQKGYFDLFPRIEYGTPDVRRSSGFLKGFIKEKQLLHKKENDHFLSWWNGILVNGFPQPSGRLKPYYAADFGTRADLPAGENPKLFIIRRQLRSSQSVTVQQGNDLGLLAAVREVKPKDMIDQKGLELGGEVLDVEVRDVWQPWLKRRCNFCARYIVPSRIDITQMLHADKRVSCEVCLSMH